MQKDPALCGSEWASTAFMIIVGTVFLAILQDTVFGYGSIAIGLLLGVSGFILTMKKK